MNVRSYFYDLRLLKKIVKTRKTQLEKQLIAVFNKTTTKD
jgi:hypothetical protein